MPFIKVLHTCVLLKNSVTQLRQSIALSSFKVKIQFLLKKLLSDVVAF